MASEGITCAEWRAGLGCGLPLFLRGGVGSHLQSEGLLDGRYGRAACGAVLEVVDSDPNPAGAALEYIVVAKLPRALDEVRALA